MKKVSNIKERIKEFAETTGVSKEIFFKNIGVTPANFRGKKLETGVNADLIGKIVSLYPSIDLHWLITGEVKNAVSEVNDVDIDYKKEVCFEDLIDKRIKIQTGSTAKKVANIETKLEGLIALIDIDGELDKIIKKRTTKR